MTVFNIYPALFVSGSHQIRTGPEHSNRGTACCHNVTSAGKQTKYFLHALSEGRNLHGLLQPTPFSAPPH